jgi:hypothetical protein
MAKNLPTKAPSLVGKIRRSSMDQSVLNHSFNSIWPKMVADKYANPLLTREQIAKKYRDSLGISLKETMTKMLNAGWRDVANAVTTTKSSAELTPSLIKSLDSIRERKGKKHLKKMMRYVDSAHTVIDSMVEDNEKDVQSAKKNLPSFLSSVSATEALGRKVFNLDKQDKDAPSTVVNLAILTRFEP